MNKKTLIVSLGLAVVLIFIFSTLTFSQPLREDGPDTAQTQKITQSAGEYDYLWAVDTSISYATGDFGTSGTVNTVYLPVTLRRLFPNGDVGVTVPYLYMESGPGVTAFSGRPFRTNGADGNGREAGGIGDMLLKGRYYLLEETAYAFNLSPTAQIKFPTADDDEGLGTGEFDETLGLEASKTLDDLWSVYGDLYYTFIGEPANKDLDNEFAYDVGAGYSMSEQTELTLFYGERTALVDGRDNPRDITLGLNHDLSQNTLLYGNAGFGLNNESPDVLLTVGMGYLF